MLDLESCTVFRSHQAPGKAACPMLPGDCCLTRLALGKPLTNTWIKQTADCLPRFSCAL